MLKKRSTQNVKLMLHKRLLTRKLLKLLRMHRLKKLKLQLKKLQRQLKKLLLKKLQQKMLKQKQKNKEFIFYTFKLRYDLSEFFMRNGMLFCRICS